MSNISGISILLVSAAAPVLIFTRLLAGRYHNFSTGCKLSCSAELFPQFLETRIQDHFHHSLKHHIDATCNGKNLQGYFKSFDKGVYTFYSHDHEPLIELKKDYRGWALVQICDGDEEKRRFVTLLILHLESKLFN